MTVKGKRPIRPAYWRMFTLSDYDGMIWSQRSGQGTPAPLFPLRNDLRHRNRGATYDIASAQAPQALHAFGAPRVLVSQTVVAQLPNTGYLPGLPAIRKLRLSGSDASDAHTVRVRPDNSVDIAVVEPERQATIYSEVPFDDNFGIVQGGPPLRGDQRSNPQAFLPPEENVLYLRLPDTLPPGHRVRELAKKILHNAQPGESNYRRALRLALAVQTGEGTDLPPPVYTLRPPPTPPQHDAADYFLFESRRGYCTYFAGALTVLCRAAGIPARVVSGFTGGEARPGSNTVLLRESNAHAWTEVWVPNWGWATIDATPSEARGDNAAGWWDNWVEMLSSLLLAGWQWSLRHVRMLVLAFSSILLVIALLLARSEGSGLTSRALSLLASKRIELHDDAARAVIYDAYGRLAHNLARRFRQRTAWETPSEWLSAAEITLELRDPQPLRRLTELYVLAKYSPYPLGKEEGIAAHQALGHLSWQRRTEDDGR
ncbi:MAG: transglutaminase domain-containing protein, partial [Armatimonadota bacterium]|nr:transglutaminase domain-containing protein [Armatimonadota bacterium]